jgi:hypothetical protein
MTWTQNLDASHLCVPNRRLTSEAEDFCAPRHPGGEVSIVVSLIVEQILLAPLVEKCHFVTFYVHVHGMCSYLLLVRPVTIRRSNADSDSNRI